MTECSPTEVYPAPVELCSSSSDAPPSAEDHIDILKEYEELFKDRYTERDEKYMTHVAEGKLPPPCAKNWFVRQNNSNRDNRRGGGRGYDNQRYHDNRERRDHQGYRNWGYQDRNYHQNHGNRSRGGYQGGHGGHGYNKHDNQYRPY